MKDILRINLDNEMDLILAHKRTIKLAELCGLMASSQTRFATAVSEIARCSITNGLDSYLLLGVNSLPGGKKEINAAIYDRVDLSKSNPEALAYAERLSKEISKSVDQDIYKITLSAKVPFSGIITDARISSFIEFFKKEAPLSPYDEIRRKNIQLIELSDKLSESENSYRQLTDTLPMIVFSISKTDQITLANKGAEKILGSRLRDFTPAFIAQIIYKTDAEEVVKVWKHVKKRNAVETVQARVNVQHEQIWHQISFVPTTDENDNVTGYIASMVNIHAQKRIEEALKDNRELKEAQEKLRQSNEELQRKNNELEQFAYIASHDLQEPLRKIRNFISLSQHNREAADKQDFYFSRINAAAERMSQLIKDVLGYSKAIKSEEFVPIDLNHIITEVKNDFEFLIHERSADIKNENLPVVYGSPVQLSQLFYNLISNAIKFARVAPVVTISYTLVKEDDKTFHKIVVSDNGIGIAANHVEKIFTIFKRLHPQNEYPGTGIGLALCRKIVDNHAGRIEIASELGIGTQISVYLPA